MARSDKTRRHVSAVISVDVEYADVMQARYNHLRDEKMRKYRAYEVSFAVNLRPQSHGRQCV